MGLIQNRLFIILLCFPLFSGCSLWQKWVVGEEKKGRNFYEEKAQKKITKIQSDFDEGQFQKVLNESKEFQTKFPGSRYYLESLFLQARSFAEIGAHEKAISSYRSLIQSQKANSDLMARTLYYSSFSYESMGQTEKVIASLNDAMSYKNSLPERIILAEAPARLAAAYMRVGNTFDAKKYFEQASLGLEQVRRNLGQSGLNQQTPDWYVKTLYFMGDLRPLISQKTYSSNLSSLERSQVYLLKAAEASEEKWSPLAAQRLIQLYLSFWNYVQAYKAPSEVDFALYEREKQKAQWEMTHQLLEVLESLKLARNPKNQEEESVKEIFSFVQSLENQMADFLTQPEKGMGLTPSAKTKSQTQKPVKLPKKENSSKTKESKIKNQRTEKGFLDTKDPNL